jgi:hypothetical protein
MGVYGGGGGLPDAEGPHEREAEEEVGHRGGREDASQSSGGQREKGGKGGR